MTSRPSARLTAVLTLSLALLALLVALLGPAQTLAQTRKACSTTTSQAKTKAGACTHSSRRGRKTRHSRRHTKLGPAKKTTRTSAPGSASVEPARCEGGETPVRAADGTFSCGDGSEPECEDGATPRPSRKGNSLVCPVSSEAESSSTAAECEEEAGCAAAAGEQPCETSGSDGSGFSCEADSED